MTYRLLLILPFALLGQFANAETYPISCDCEQLEEASASLEEAKNMVDKSLEYLEGDDKTVQEMILKFVWFNSTNAEFDEQLVSKYEKIKGFLDGVQFVCLAGSSEGGSEFAHVDVSSNLFLITLGSLFWNETQDEDYNSKAGTIIHEVSHFVLTGNTDDITYGVEHSKELAKNDPDKALTNADNFQYFSESVFYELEE